MRVIYLSIGKKTFSKAAKSLALEISGISYYISFARYGIDKTWKTIVSHETDDISLHQINEETLRFRKILSHTAKHSEEFRKLNSRYCLNHDKKILVMHFRSGQYHEDGNRRNRNASIESYQLEINKLGMKHGYQVVIIGDENNLDFDNRADILNLPKLIPNIQQRRNFEIQALCSADLYIGTQSGPWDLAMLLGITSIVFNSIDLSTAESACWSNTIIVSKQIKSDKSIDSWIKDYECDLNGEDGGHTLFQDINSKELFTQICDALIKEDKGEPCLINMLPVGYYSKSNFSARTRQVLKHIGGLHLVIPNQINGIATKLIDKWTRLANRLELKSEADYFTAEIFRLVAKRKLSESERSVCYLDKEGFNK